MQKQCIGWNICDFGTWYFSTFSHFFSSGEKWRERYRDYKDFYMYIYY